MDDIVVDELKKCINLENFSSYLQSHTFVEFEIAFREVFVVIKKMKEEQFFHGDISPSYIVIDEGVFKFIDII